MATAGLVSLVITVHNREQYLDAAIASVLAQTHTNWELIIWDDGSSDRTVAIAQNYARQDQRIRVIAAPHWGRVAALKAAIAQTTGAYLGWLDSDDWLAATAVAETLAVLQNQPDVGMVYTDYLDVDAAGKLLGYGKRCHIPYSRDRLLLDFMTFHFRLIRRSVFDQVGGIDRASDLVEDYDLCLRLSEVTQVERVRKPLYYYRHHGNNASYQWRIEQVLRSQAAIRQALHRRGLADQYTIEVTLPAGQFRLRRQTTPKAVGSRPQLLPTPTRSSHVRRSWLYRVGVIPLLLANLGAGTAHAQSIITAPDGTNTLVTPNGTQFDITGGTLSGDGTNLFHSFQQFGLNAGETANFLSNPQIRNILGRVTGSNPSIINGLIQVTGGNSNLYLMNPAGIVFGSNASLNVPASFTATTANSIGFGNGGWFRAIGTNDYAALGGNPQRFAFITPQPGSIINAGNLAVSLGQRLTLLGGTVLNTGTLTAPGGEVILTAVPGANLVSLSETGSPLRLEFSPLDAVPDTTVPAPASLPALLTGGNLASATGVSVNGNGTIRLTGSTVDVPTKTGTAIVGGRVNVSGTTAGSIYVLGDRVGLIGANLNASGATGGGTVLIGGDYRGAGTVPNASSTFVDGNSTIAANSLVSGNGGRVILWAEEVTRFFGNISAQGGSVAGDGGFVEVSGKGDLVYRGQVSVAAAVGKAGTLLLDPTDIIIQPGSGYGTGDTELPDIFVTDFPGTTITLFQNTLALVEGDLILEASNDIIIQPMGKVGLEAASSITFRADADGNGVGSFRMSPTDTINTRGPINISGANLTIGSIITTGFSTGASITLSAANDITATTLSTTMTFGDTGSVTLTAGGAIAVIGAIQTFSGGYGFGYQAGDVTAVAGSINIGSIDASNNGLDGGNVTLDATGNITTGSINTTVGSAQTPGGAGGSVTITSDAGAIATGEILTTSATGNGGSVNLTAAGDVQFSRIETAATGTGQGGDVSIAAGGFVRGTGVGRTGATIDTTDAGGGGSITIEHDGGARGIPFVVGEAATNGTAGSITSGAETIAPIQSFPDDYIQGNISIITSSPPATPPIEPPIEPPVEEPPEPEVATPNDELEEFADELNDTEDEVDASEVDLDNAATVEDAGETEVAAADEEVTDEFEDYLDLPDDVPKTEVEATEDILSRVGSLTGVKPALVYAAFVPASVATTPPPINQPLSQKFRQETGAIAKQKAIAPSSQFLPATGFHPGSSPVANRLHSQQTRREKLPPNNNDQLELIVVTADGKPIRRLIAGATRERVLATTRQFLNEISDPRKVRTTSYLAAAQQLYRWLVAPIEPLLKERSIGNLAYIADTGLRFIPLAALHDGQQFLVEKYSVGLMPSLSLTDTRYVNLREARVLAMGASEFNDQSDLPAVPAELMAVTQLLNGEALLNQNFTVPNLTTERRQETYQILHLATHGEFQEGALNNSYIQFWDSKLRLDQIRQLSLNQPPVELLVLSACRTALGSDEAELGFAGFAVQAGVKSVLASLWSVSDEGTLGLMTEFYRQLKTAPIKAEALRQAQIAMLKGQVTVEGNQLRGSRGGDITLPTPLSIGGKRALTHPYYWSAFTLIGSPW